MIFGATDHIITSRTIALIRCKALSSEISSPTWHRGYEVCSNFWSHPAAVTTPQGNYFE